MRSGAPVAVIGRPGSGASPKALFEARVRQGTGGGVIRSGDKAVFAASAPPRRPGKVSERAATGDLWSGFGPAGRTATAGAEGSALAGSGAALWAGTTLLSLGLLGICGSFALVALRRRHAEAKAPAEGGSAAEM